MGPELAAVADALRGTFGARLTYLDTPTLKRGKRPDPFLDGAFTAPDVPRGPYRGKDSERATRRREPKEARP